MSDEVATTTGSEVAVPDEDVLGLEDFDRSDQSIPRLTIVQAEAEFEDSLTGQRYPELDAILLGLVKQRVLWAPEVGESDHPWCKSLDAKVGRPADEFPWDASGFDRGAYNGEGAQPELPCGSCALKEWDSHPTRNTPWCGEQYVIPLLMQEDNGKVVAALVTFQRSSIKPVKQYLSGFASRGEPLFTVRTTITLNARKRGNVDFAVPKLRRGDVVPDEMHSELGSKYREIRAFLTTPRQEEYESTSEAEPVKTEPAPTPEPTPEPEPAAASSDEGDDELF